MTFAAAFASAAPNLITAAYPGLGPIATPRSVLISPASSFASVLAADQLAHLIEGWRFLSSAVQSALVNAQGQAVHFAYYAELRSAMSIFSGAGIKINNHKNDYLRGDGGKVRFSTHATHDAVWKAWNAWAADATAVALVEENIFPFAGLNLREIQIQLAAISPGASFRGWGLDLKPGADHKARNNKSYKPYWASEPFVEMTEDDRNFIRDAWHLLLPNVAGALEFDVAFLRYWLHNAMKELPDRSFANRRAKYMSILQFIANRTGLSEPAVSEFLKGAKRQSRVIAEAADSKSTWRSMLARAVCMLRIGLVSVQRHIQSAGGCPNVVKWTESWFRHAGLWTPESGVSRTDYVADYENAVRNFTWKGVFPRDIWSTAGRCVEGALLMRPDACLVWAGPA